MTISPFATQQTDVFIPALGALAAATLCAVLPVILAPALRRRRAGRVLSALAIVVAAVLLVVAAVAAGAGFRTLADERTRLQSRIADDYGLRLDIGQVGTLIDGGGLQLPQYGYGTRGVRFQAVPRQPGDYRLVYGSGATATPLPEKA